MRQPMGQPGQQMGQTVQQMGQSGQQMGQPGQQMNPIVQQMGQSMQQPGQQMTQAMGGQMQPGQRMQMGPMGPISNQSGEHAPYFHCIRSVHCNWQPQTGGLIVYLMALDAPNCKLKPAKMCPSTS